MDYQIKTKYFHGLLDELVPFEPGRVVETKETEYIIIQERELSYRFHLHQHPYVQQLVQRLLREGTSGLQAADTEYAPGEISLPFGVDFELETGVDSTIPEGSRIGLLDKVTATGEYIGSQVELAPKDEFELAEIAQIRLFAGTRATFEAPMEPTPHPRSKFVLGDHKTAIISADTRIKLTMAAKLLLSDGTKVSIPAGTEVLLAAGTPFEVSGGIEVTLLRRRMRPTKDLYSDNFSAIYQPNQALVQQPYPVKDLDFTSGGAYSVYNWELFYHVPITIAIHLSKNQRFAEAQHWFHYLFDPTDDSDGPTPERFWKVRPFQYTDVKKIEEILVNLVTEADKTLRDETIFSIEAWKDAPFRPHVIARYRQQAYMYKTVMAYLDNLIAWGDSLFRQDTGEAIDEALMLYVLAANILGPRPQPVPKKGSVRPQTYANLRQDLKQFGAVMRDIETALPFDLGPFPSEDTGDNERLATLRSLGKALYFCVPRNDKLLSYWDTVADRLFKIRNSLNIQGIFRQLPLFEPPIDPAMLARAAAAGLDIGAIINGLNQPLPLVRFQFLVQKATEICQEVKSLGSNLLAAMEKEDGEALAILRARHERVVMDMVEYVKCAQLQEAIKAKEGLLQTLALAVQRYTYYEKQLGKEPDETPELDESETTDSLEKMKCTDSLAEMRSAIQEPDLNLPEIEVDISEELGNEGGGRKMNTQEAKEMEKLKEARDAQEAAAEKDRIGAGLGIIPDFGIDLKPLGVGATTTLGGSTATRVMSFWASFGRADADKHTYEAGKTAKIGSYARREQEWAFQSNLAAGEINQIFKQIRAAQIREAIAKRECENHQQQMKHAEDIEQFLKGEETSIGDKKHKKTSTQDFYTWMKREVKGLYGQVFQFAFDIAKKAERALQHELGNPELNYLQFGYLAGKEGLLAGEKLYLDIKRMEMAYHDLNQREYELTKHVSLLQVNPLALLQLRTTGRCTVFLPEELFDMDCPGHYFRRIKSAAVSIPCVTGPYTSINCTLSLLKSSIRKNSLLRDGSYAREGAEDDRFSDHFGSLQSIVTSTGQNDSGLFETNLRDERYLPFENSGVISEWQLQLPADPTKGDPAQFDYNTISDVILHIRYTAREGGGLLRNGAVTNLNERIAGAQTVGSVRLFSVRHEFPSEWAKFTSVEIDDATPVPELTLDLKPEHFPFWSQGRLEAVKRIDLYEDSENPLTPDSMSGVIITCNPDGTEKSRDNWNTLKEISFPNPPDKFILKFNIQLDNNTMKNLWLTLTWGKEV